MSLYLIRAGSHGEFETKFLEENKVFLTWENLSHDLSTVPDRPALIALLQTNEPGASPRRLSNNT